MLWAGRWCPLAARSTLWWPLLTTNSLPPVLTLLGCYDPGSIFSHWVTGCAACPPLGAFGGSIGWTRNRATSINFPSQCLNGEPEPKHHAGVYTTPP
ncbi:hypothetical protein L208DRAFT_735329 [Tricholoma matsutake]|nr:hypothetical protein L208DRAFT_735329 [Tricholoma matsutake 945]